MFQIPNVTMFKQMMAHKRGVSFIEQFYLAGHSVVKKTPQQFLDKLEGSPHFIYFFPLVIIPLLICEFVKAFKMTYLLSL